MKKKILKTIIIVLVLVIAVLAGIFYPRWEEASHDHEHSEEIVIEDIDHLNY